MALLLFIVGLFLLFAGCWALVRWLDIPDHTCPDCGHYFGGIEGPAHDRTACEVAKLRKALVENGLIK